MAATPIPDGLDPLFASRKEAGRLLGGLIAGRRYSQPVVIALPAASIRVAFEVASSLRAPLDVLVLCGRDHERERDCVCSRGDGTASVEELSAAAGCAGSSAAELQRELEEVRRREQACRRGRPPLAIAGLTSILVDDGSASTADLRVALGRLRCRRPKRVVLALPLVQRETARALAAETDDRIHLFEIAAGQRARYGDRGQASDEEVAAVLELAASTTGA